jgi:hypothetical protein
MMIMNQKIYQDKRLVNGAMDAISEIIWPFFRRSQLYDQDLPAVKRNWLSSNRCDDCRISSKIRVVKQLTGKYYCIYVGDAQVRRMQGTKVCTAAVNFWDRNYMHLDKPMSYWVE